jgi:hypothetical protein
MDATSTPTTSHQKNIAIEDLWACTRKLLINYDLLGADLHLFRREAADTSAERVKKKRCTHLPKTQQLSVGGGDSPKSSLLAWRLISLLLFLFC